MFLHPSLSHSVHRGHTPLPWADTPVGKHPRADTPIAPPLGRDPQADTQPFGRHPLGSPPTGQTPPPGQTCLGQAPPMGRHLRPETATSADGTHPTGIHSCSMKIVTYSYDTATQHRLLNMIPVTFRALSPSSRVWSISPLVPSNLISFELPSLS